MAQPLFQGDALSYPSQHQQYCCWTTTPPSSFTNQAYFQTPLQQPTTAFTPIHQSPWNYTPIAQSTYGQFYQETSQAVDYEPVPKRPRLPMDDTAATTTTRTTVVIRRQCISKKNAKRLKRLKHLRNFFSASLQHSAVDPSSWCFHFWLETLREIKLSQSGFERVTSKLKQLSPFMSQAIQQLSSVYQMDIYMLLAAVISLPFVAETELTVERSFVTFCDLIEDILKINGILESELNEKFVRPGGITPDLKTNLKPKKARLSVIVSALFNNLNELKTRAELETIRNESRQFLQHPYGAYL